jgi:hypothetical protein
MIKDKLRLSLFKTPMEKRVSINLISESNT